MYVYVVDSGVCPLSGVTIAKDIRVPAQFTFVHGPWQFVRFAVRRIYCAESVKSQSLVRHIIVDC